MQLNKVVLQAPFGPIKPMISPCSIWKEIWLLATTPPKSLIRSVTSRNATLCTPFPKLFNDAPDSSGLIGRDNHDQRRVNNKVNSDQSFLGTQPASEKAVKGD